MQTITPNLEQAEFYTAELSDAEMYYQNSQSANALKCFGNATIICLPDNNLHEHAMECSEANRFLKCNLFVYDDASCDPSQRGNICRLIVTDAQRFGILDDSCRTQLDQACANNNAPTTTPTVDITTPTVGTATTSNSVFRIEICSWNPQVFAHDKRA
uniref:Uncharacterized protein n=1 Tax=Acrobeloides nanus TaxID=290746 RepID=A0A914CTR0_9BILA